MLVTFGTSSGRRPLRPGLAERQIAPENSDTGRAECLGKSNKERSVAVGSCPVRQYEGVSAWGSGLMQDSTYRRFEEWFTVVHLTLRFAIDYLFDCDRLTGSAKPAVSPPKKKKDGLTPGCIHRTVAALI